MHMTISPSRAQNPTAVRLTGRSTPAARRGWPPITIHPLTPTQRKAHLRIGYAKLDAMISQLEKSRDRRCQGRRRGLGSDRFAELCDLHELVGRALAGERVLEDPTQVASWRAACETLDEFFDDYDSDERPGAERFLGAVVGTRLYATGGSMAAFGSKPYPYRRCTIDEEIAENGLAQGSPAPTNPWAS